MLRKSTKLLPVDKHHHMIKAFSIITFVYVKTLTKSCFLQSSLFKHQESSEIFYSHLFI